MKSNESKTRQKKSLKRRRKHRSIPGSPPGTLESHHEGETSIQVIAYNPDRIEVLDAPDFGSLRTQSEEFDTVWINMIGLADLSVIKRLGLAFGIHQLTLEDIVNVHQRAKFETFESYEYFVTRMARFTEEGTPNTIQTEQLSIVLTGKFVITFQQVAEDCLDPVRRRLKEMSGLIRERGPDYLVYVLIDTVVDHYFPIVDVLSDLVEDFDDALLAENMNVSAKDIHHVRRQLLNLSRHVRSHREMLGRLLREPTGFTDQTRVFVNDCFDHILQLGETIEINREACSDLRAYHLALTGNRTNEVMKTLTIVSSIFIPLSFIAGLYGMNFENMPELKWSFGYFAALGLMVAVASGLLLWFRKRGWFD